MATATEWIKARLKSQNKARAYKKTVDAPAFVQAMDLAECRANCPSFDKLCRELEARVPPPQGAVEGPDANIPPDPEQPAEPAS
jgi:hypothetical protein